jgi:hypothetical protein
MIRFIPALLYLLTAAVASFSGPDDKNEAEFFAGVTLLSQKTDLKPAEKAEKFRELEAMTGISAAEADRILVQYREKPAEWQKIYDVTLKLLNETNLRIQKKDSIKTVLKDAGKKISPMPVKKPAPLFKTKR